MFSPVFAAFALVLAVVVLLGVLSAAMLLVGLRSPGRRVPPGPARRTYAGQGLDRNAYERFGRLITGAPRIRHNHFLP